MVCTVCTCGGGGGGGGGGDSGGNVHISWPGELCVGWGVKAAHTERASQFWAGHPRDGACDGATANVTLGNVRYNTTRDTSKISVYLACSY